MTIYDLPFGRPLSVSVTQTGYSVDKINLNRLYTQREHSKVWTVKRIKKLKKNQGRYYTTALVF